MNRIIEIYLIVITLLLYKEKNFILIIYFKIVLEIFMSFSIIENV